MVTAQPAPSRGRGLGNVRWDRGPAAGLAGGSQNAAALRAGRDSQPGISVSEWAWISAECRGRVLQVEAIRA
jgi:hypothetical protein